MEFTREARASRQRRELDGKLDRELTPDRRRKLPMHRRLLFKTVTWVAMCLLVTSCGLAQEPVKEPTAVRWPAGLITAIQANDLPAVKESLEKGAEVNARNNDGWTPLMLAAGKSSTPEIVTLLLDKGAEVEARDKDGSTPLLIAAGKSTTRRTDPLVLERRFQQLSWPRFLQRCWLLPNRQ